MIFLITDPLILRKKISHSIESLIFEFIIRNEKWWFTCIYNPRNKHKIICYDSIDDVVNAVNSEHIKTSFILGDLNINMPCDHDRRALDDILDVYKNEEHHYFPNMFQVSRQTNSMWCHSDNKQRHTTNIWCDIHPSPKVMADFFQTQRLTWCPYPICMILVGA